MSPKRSKTIIDNTFVLALVYIDLIGAFIFLVVAKVAEYLPWPMLFAWSFAAMFFLTGSLMAFFFCVFIAAWLRRTYTQTISIPVKFILAISSLGLSVLLFMPVFVFSRDAFGFNPVSRVAVIEKVQKNHMGYRSSCTYSVYLKDSEDPIRATCGMVNSTFGGATAAGKAYTIVYLIHSNLLLSADMKTQ